jgi:hypothetical protein
MADRVKLTETTVRMIISATAPELRLAVLRAIFTAGRAHLASSGKTEE